MNTQQELLVASTSLSGLFGVLVGGVVTARWMARHAVAFSAGRRHERHQVEMEQAEAARAQRPRPAAPAQHEPFPHFRSVTVSPPPPSGHQQPVSHPGLDAPTQHFGRPVDATRELPRPGRLR